MATWVVTFWYPPALFKMAGFDRLLAVPAMVDLVAGPLLTLIVFRAGKPGLRFDLTVIGCAQATLLAYGLSVIWAARPVYLVATHDRFDIVFANQIEPAELTQAPRPQWRELGAAGPQLVGAQSPGDPDLAGETLFEALAGRDITVRPQFYVDFDEIAPTLLGKARRLEDPEANKSV